MPTTPGDRYRGAPIPGTCRQAGIALLNQSVLLRGVNDSVGALADLSEALFAAGVLPYYLHALDKVQGAAHFEVSEADAGRILTELAPVCPATWCRAW